MKISYYLCPDCGGVLYDAEDGRLICWGLRVGKEHKTTHWTREQLLRRVLDKLVKSQEESNG